MALPIPLLIAAAELVPGVMKLFKGDKQAAVAEKVVGIAKKITGQDDAAAAIEAIKKDPALLVQLEAQAKDIAIAELHAETAQQQQTNETIRAELVSSSLFKSGWRPLYGWLLTPIFNLWVLVTTFIPLYAILKYPDRVGEIITQLVAYVGAMMIIWGAAFAVLGVNVRQRTIDKQTAAGVPSAPGLLSFFSRR